MSALSLFDYFLSFDPASKDGGGRPDLGIARGWADRLTGELIAEYADLRAIDAQLADAAGFNPQVALLMRQTYEEWAGRAGAVLKRVARLGGHGVTVARAEELRDAWAWATFASTYDEAADRRAEGQIARGETVTGEEVRRELRTRRTA